MAATHAGTLHDPTAALVIIGNEILTGKLVDQNSPFLLKELFQLGVTVKRVVTISDDVDVIAHEVRLASERHDFVLTSGGVGPTHDDVTLSGIAAAFGVELVRHPMLQAMLEAHFGADITPAAQRMALIPEGSRLLQREGMRYPLLVCGNVYVFPGVPDFLRRKFDAIKDEFRGRPYHLLEISTWDTEDLIAQPLQDTVDAFAAVEIGSYPRFGEGPPWVLLTLQSKEPETLERARAFLCARLNPERLISDGCRKGS